MNRDWTEAEARAWLRASLPKGWVCSAWQTIEGAGDNPRDVFCTATMRRGYERNITTHRESRATYRSACRALIRAAKRAGIAVNQVQEPGGK